MADTKTKTKTITIDRKRLYDKLRANMFDGSDDGVATLGPMRTTDLLKDIVDAVFGAED